MSDDPVAVLEAVTNRARWAGMARNVLVSVRRIDETDEETLRRLVEDYGAMVAQIRDSATPEERRRLDDKCKGDVPRALAAILAKTCAARTAA